MANLIFDNSYTSITKLDEGRLLFVNKRAGNEFHVEANEFEIELDIKKPECWGWVISNKKECPIKDVPANNWRNLYKDAHIGIFITDENFTLTCPHNNWTMIRLFSDSLGIRVEIDNAFISESGPENWDQVIS